MSLSSLGITSFVVPPVVSDGAYGIFFYLNMWLIVITCLFQHNVVGLSSHFFCSIVSHFYLHTCIFFHFYRCTIQSNNSIMFSMLLADVFFVRNSNARSGEREDSHDERLGLDDQDHTSHHGQSDVHHNNHHDHTNNATAK